MSTVPLLEVRDVKVHFDVTIPGALTGRHALLKALDGASFSLAGGETLGIVGESGCGKSTLARAILGLVRPTGGEVLFAGRTIARLSAKALRPLRRDMQIIFQDPLAALDPRMTVGEIIAEPLETFMPSRSGSDVKARVKDTMADVGLSPLMINRYPHELSGGQCQRVGIARAIILKPKLLVCDEPVSALDVSIQAQIINLLMRLQRELGLALIVISHDLSILRHISARILVLYLGRAMERAGCDELFGNPLHPYTRALMAAVPVPDPDREAGRARALVAGEPPSPLDPPSGCVFRTRCPKATALCAEVAPAEEAVSPTHTVACHHWREPGEQNLPR
jgi:oligopeptide transport system ATP-binding protein